MSLAAKNRLKSSWTPLGNEDTNNKIFEERKILIGKWFDKWNDDQRKKILEDLLGRSKLRQLAHAGDIVSKRVPVHHDDFTRQLPRVLSVYIFSFLDPRSLCRCSQVCWSWKYVSELDQLWLPKCVRLGWILNFTPSPYETGIWKRHYIENIKSLQYLRPKEPPKPPLSDLEKMKLEAEAENARRWRSKQKSAKGPPPWKGSDPIPKDTWRFNYLQNEDEVEKVRRIRQKGLGNAETEDIIRKAKNKVNTGNNALNTKHTISITKSHAPGERPNWARPDSSSPQVNWSYAGDARTSLDASVRPSPVKSTITLSTRQADDKHAKRSAIDPPTSSLFRSSPWRIPDSTGNDSD